MLFRPRLTWHVDSFDVFITWLPGHQTSQVFFLPFLLLFLYFVVSPLSSRYSHILRPLPGHSTTAIYFFGLNLEIISSKNSAYWSYMEFFVTFVPLLRVLLTHPICFPIMLYCNYLFAHLDLVFWGLECLLLMYPQSLTHNRHSINIYFKGVNNLILTSLSCFSPICLSKS